MVEDCFSSLLSYGRKFDDGIKRLTEIWRYPQNIIGGYGSDEQLAEANLRILKSEITTLKKTVTDDTKSWGNYAAEMDTFLEESQQTFDDLVQSCNEVGTVLSEYGYVRPEDESLANKLETECSINSSLISSDVTDDLLEVEFTPDMTWRHRAKTNVSLRE